VDIRNVALRGRRDGLAWPALGDEPAPQGEPHALPDRASFGSIRGFDSRFDRLVPKDAKLEKLAQGLFGAKGRCGFATADFCCFPISREIGS